jgi:hypothetical protein
VGLHPYGFQVLLLAFLAQVDGDDVLLDMGFDGFIVYSFP